MNEIDPDILKLTLQSLGGHFLWIVIGVLAMVLMKDVIKTFIASWMFYFDTTYRITDPVRVDGKDGYISSIGWRSITFVFFDEKDKSVSWQSVRTDELSTIKLERMERHG